MEFIEVAGWGGDRWSADVTGVAVDARDYVYALKREKLAVTVLDPQGVVLDRWGHPCLSDRPHLITIGSDNRIYIADDGGHQIHIFETSGKWLETIGTGTPTETGFDTCKGTTEEAYEQMSGGPPFNRPTKAIVVKNGDIYVSDGYRNCKIHRISADRQHIVSWGKAGAQAGCFVIPHSVQVDAQGRIFVCDRENDRIQIFSPEGTLLAVWENVQRPTDIAFDAQGLAYVSELPRGPKDIKSWRLGKAHEELPGSVTIRSAEGEVLFQLDHTLSDFLAPHAITVDSMGSVYISEVPESFANYTGRTIIAHTCLRKFMRVNSPQ